MRVVDILCKSNVVNVSVVTLSFAWWWWWFALLSAVGVSVLSVLCPDDVSVDKKLADIFETKNSEFRCTRKTVPCSILDRRKRSHIALLCQRAYLWSSLKPLDPTATLIESSSLSTLHNNSKSTFPCCLHLCFLPRLVFLLQSSVSFTWIEPVDKVPDTISIFISRHHDPRKLSNSCLPNVEHCYLRHSPTDSTTRRFHKRLFTVCSK